MPPAHVRLPGIAVAGLLFCTACTVPDPSTATRAQRPVTQEKTMITVQPPEGNADATMAVLAALDTCRDQGADGVRFATGTYHFHAGGNPANPGINVVAQGFDGLVIDGSGSEFVFHGVTAPFYFSACSNLEIRNFSIDWERPPFSPGEVIAVHDSAFDVRVFDEFPVSGGEPVGAFMEYDPETGRPKRDCLDVYYQVSHTELIAPQTLRVHTKVHCPMTKGAWTVLRHEVYGRNAFVLSNCRNVSIHDVNVYTCPGMALVADRSADVTLRRFNVLIRPGTRRLMSVTADATHWGGCTGTVRIEDCVFEGMGDDAVNCKTGLYLTIEEKEDARTVLARHNLKMACVPDPGDELEFVPQATLLPYLTLEVESAELLSRDPQSPQQGLHRVRFTQPLPDSVGVGDLMGNTTRSPVLRVRNCVMRHHRARGMLIQVRDAIVEDCLFEGCTAGGIWALTEVTHFYECISPRNIVIRNNRFIDCTFGGPTGWGVLGVYAIMKGFEHPTQPGIFRDIVIENNVIEGSQNSGIILSGAEDVILRHNTVTGTGSNPTVPEGRSAIHIRASRGIVLEGNRVLPQEQEPGCEASLTIHPDSDPATFSFQGNTGFVAPE